MYENDTDRIILKIFLWQNLSAKISLKTNLILSVPCNATFIIKTYYVGSFIKYVTLKPTFLSSRPIYDVAERLK